MIRLERSERSRRPSPLVLPHLESLVWSERQIPVREQAFEPDDQPAQGRPFGDAEIRVEQQPVLAGPPIEQQRVALRPRVIQESEYEERRDRSDGVEKVRECDLVVLQASARICC